MQNRQTRALLPRPLRIYNFHLKAAKKLRHKLIHLQRRQISTRAHHRALGEPDLALVAKARGGGVGGEVVGPALRAEEGGVGAVDLDAVADGPLGDTGFYGGGEEVA
jgi:hypothetical protein